MTLEGGEGRRVFFVGIAYKLENIYITFSGFNPCPSLPSVETDDRKQFQYLNIFLNN